MDGLADWLAERADGLIAPAYGGGSLVNLPATVGAMLGASRGWQAPALAQRHGLRARASRVLLLVIDGLGLRALERHPVLAERLQGRAVRRGGVFTALTSVVPSTTSVATTVLLGSGAAPARLGVLGFSQRLPRLDLVANMLFWTVQGGEGGLERRGLEPETFLPTPSLFQSLDRQRVASAAFLPAAIARSPLSRMQFRGVAPRGSAGLAEALAGASTFLSQRRRAFAYVYLPDLDTVSHREGPEGAAWRRVLRGLLDTLEAWLAGPATALDDSWLLITADHGLIGTPPGQRRLVAEFDDLAPLQACRPGGEARHLLLYARNGAEAELLAAVRERLGEDWLVVEGGAALQAGLYGDPERLHPEAGRRLGDVVALARGHASLWADDPATVLLGMHGSLEADEMLVPLVALPLGS